MKLLSTKTIEQALEMSKTGVLKRAEREKWNGRTDRSGKLWALNSMSTETQIKVASWLKRNTAMPPELVDPEPVKPEEAQYYKEATETERETARLRALLLSELNKSGMKALEFIKEYNAGRVAAELYETLGQVSKASLYRWRAAYNKEGVDGLVPKYSQRSTKGEVSLNELEKGIIEHFFCSPERRTMKHCYNQLRFLCPETKATYGQVARYIKSLPEPYKDYYRLGNHKFGAKYQPYIDREPKLYSPMEQVVSDHHCFDFVVYKEGKLVRPWITAFQDYRSSKIVGYCVSAYPSSITIGISFYQMASRYGLPGMVHFDNGKDYRSQMLNGKKGKIISFTEQGEEKEVQIKLQGLLELLGVEVTFSEIDHGQSKGRMERTFGTFAEYFAKNTGTYIGSNTVTRPEDSALFFRSLNGKAKRNDVPRWNDFLEAIEAFIPWWNENWRGEGKGMDGMTPNEVFDSNESTGRPIDKETLILSLSKAEVRKVRENGVTLDGVDYWAKELFEYSGRQVVVRRPLADPDRVLITDPQGKTICTAVASYFVESGDLSEDVDRVRSARKENIAALKRFGVGRKAPEGKGILELAKREHKKEQIAEDYLDNLPIAAGAEPPKSKEPGKKYINPLDL